MSVPRVIQQYFLPMDGHLMPGPSSLMPESPSETPPSADPADLLRLIAEANAHHGYGIPESPKSQMERLLSAAAAGPSSNSDLAENFAAGVEVSAFGVPSDYSFGDFSIATLRNSSKTLKCPKCNWHYKYQETLEIHMKEKHSESEVKCLYCVENRPHPKLSRGETYSCGYKPYRCELCRYSTTTKGNLSIHMQSDKHLHAMQELPNSIASLGCQRTTRSPVQEGEAAFVCLVCGCFSCDSLQEMIDHAEKDRSRPSSSDVSFAGGIFRCHLCPYHTNLKANFQLHTRTDKHLQRVQLVNHIREGTNASSALCRLGAAKSVFQVLCRPCQEILPTGTAFRDHSEAVSHRTNLRQPVPIFRCRLCPYETQQKSDALGHMACHDPATWPSNDKIDLDAMAVEEDAAYACASCEFTAKDSLTLEEHARSHEEGELCPLCNERTTNITDHLLQDHKIAESAVEKLMQVHRVENIGTTTHTFRCNRCSLSFRTESALHSHSIIHLFDAAQKCPQCSVICNSVEELKSHSDSEHSKSDEENKCELCNENFNSRAQFLAHINSVRHLHEAKKQLEQGSVSLNQQVLASLNPSSPGEKKPFRCNVCKIGYGQGATLDIHLRSVAHQSRMNKLGELVAAKEIDPTKPVLEQPGGPPQKFIKELLREEEMPATSQQNAMTVFNLMNMLMGGQQNNLGLSFAGGAAGDGEDDVGAPKNVTDLLNMLRTFGLDRINAANPEVILKLGRLERLSSEQVPSLCRVDCAECGQTHSSIVLLGVHYQEVHGTLLPEAVLKRFCERLMAHPTDSGSSTSNGHDSPSASRGRNSRDSSEPPEKRPRSGPTPPEKPDFSQMAMLSMMGMNGFPFPLPGNPFISAEMFNPLLAAQQLQMAQSPAKRARTRISDDQLKVLRQYFDINNSPSEAQIKEMSQKAGLPEKVIKHWFRNTLFKERQRDKDSPYNFSVPPQVGIDLDAYEKTGETKVVPLTPEIKQEIKLQQDPPGGGEPVMKTAKIDHGVALPTTPTFNLATMMQQMQQNPFPFNLDPQSLLHGQMSQLPSQNSSTGRRANRTRFTDFQLRTLQQFFDKQAYPKDDDLEILSKKLQLSPRVIVVWFQNARQKARKIYENQPNHESSDRFHRTPGCNFQCKRCNLVFQRYYELIQHQQKICYKDDGLAQASDNKGVEEGLTDDEKAMISQNTVDQQHQQQKPSPADILKLLGAGGKTSTEALLKMCESANLPPLSPQTRTGSAEGVSVGYSKRCPYCGILHRSRDGLIQHLALQHAQQMLFAPVDVDALPEAESIPTLSTSADSGVLDLSNNERDFSMSPFLGGQSDGDDVFDTTEEAALAALVNSTPASRSPAGNKRYRTHLTPVQVHVMKSVFADYKTPSMSECECLGRDIGLHKRVVQVWFQNARAKERKNRANGEGEEMFRSTATSCQLCSVDYGGRLTLQDHLFSQSHLAALKCQGLEGGNNVTEILENGASPPKSSSISLPFNKQPGSKGHQNPTMSSMMNGFPFQFGMLPAGLPLVFDQSLFGVSVSVLQVPDSVKEQIKSDMAAGESQTRFTHDGETVDALREQLLSSDDAACLEEEDVEVGWGCPTCGNVFQMESQLQNHQQQFCRGTETFTLIQTHYGCSACSSKFGSQREFISHLSTAEHLTRLASAAANNS